MRVLFIPDAPPGGTSERAPMVLRMIRERHDVATLPAPWDRVIYDRAYALWARALLYGIDKVVLLLRGLVLARRFRATLVFCETVHHALVGMGIARILGIRCVWDSHGNGKLFYESLGRDRRSVRLIEILERFVGKRVDALVTVSELDAAAYVGMGIPREKIHIVPVCVQLPPVTTLHPEEVRDEGGPEGHAVLLFFGSFRYEPNREALDFLNRRLAPFLAGRGLPCEIRIAGRDVPDLEYHPLVRPLGFVPDVHSEIRSATLCVVPVRRGVGTLTKVIDAMAVGTPVVLSDFAARGIPEIRPGVHAYVAATDEEFLECVVEALSHPDAARAMSRRARRLMEQGYDWEVGAERLAEAVRAGAFGHGGERA